MALKTTVGKNIETDFKEDLNHLRNTEFNIDSPLLILESAFKEMDHDTNISDTISAGGVIKFWH